MEKNLVKITEEEFENGMDKLYISLPQKKQEDLLTEMECLGNCKISKFTEVKYYYDKKEKEYTYRVETKY